MAGFGGAIKNISIGIASSEGKSHIHSGGTGGSMWGGDQDAFLESMAEAGKSVVDYLDGNILYINVMNRPARQSPTHWQPRFPNSPAASFPWNGMPCEYVLLGTRRPILYINVMNRLSVDCDCDGSPAEPDMHDIGILASYDPVALDQETRLPSTIPDTQYLKICSS